VVAKRLIKSEGDKDDLAKDVIKLTFFGEEKNGAMDDSSVKRDRKILELLRDIKMLVKEP
jgi:hypothetical protein